MTLNELCGDLKNYFDYDRREGTYTISGGVLTVDGLQNGQYFRIAGSVFNDGVYMYPASGLIDETFTGLIWFMAVPLDVVNLVSDINTWQAKYAEGLAGPYQSESFGGYSYTKKSGSGSGGEYTWKDAFKSRMDRWRKICPY